MIRVTIALHPSDGGKPRTLHEIDIANVARIYGDEYEYSVTTAGRHRLVLHFPARGVIDLVRRALDAMWRP